MTKVYVTRYALGDGIFAVDAEVDADLKIATYIDPYTNYPYTNYLHGADFHLTPEAALADAEKRRADKIASIKKQIAKLETMAFPIKDEVSVREPSA